MLSKMKSPQFERRRSKYDFVDYVHTHHLTDLCRRIIYKTYSKMEVPVSMNTTVNPYQSQIDSDVINQTFIFDIYTNIIE